MALDSKLVRILKIINVVGVSQVLEDPVTTESLMWMFAIGERTLRRDIETARTLGADMTSHRTSDGYIWHCDNFEQVRHHVADLLRFDAEGLVSTEPVTSV